MKIGMDLGSTAIKVVLIKNGRILWRGQKPTAPGQARLGQSLVDQALADLNLKNTDISGVAVTGYGKKLFERADLKVDEISANALGLYILSDKQARRIVNIGGQDLKILTLNEEGKVIDFRMNDKCAAGTGRFFELVSRLLDLEVTELCEYGSDPEIEEIDLNSTCIVFAESEIVSLLARGVPKEAIIKALHRSVARRIISLAGRDFVGQDNVWLDGGPAINKSLVSALEDELMAPVYVSEFPQHTVAFGAASSI